jgi:hypothetical protein
MNAATVKQHAFGKSRFARIDMSRNANVPKSFNSVHFKDLKFQSFNIQKSLVPPGCARPITITETIIGPEIGAPG